MLGRIGCFFLIIGAALVALFLTSDLVHDTDPRFLFYGVLVGLFGFLLWRKGRKPPTLTGRFRTLHRLRGASDDDQQPSDQ